MREAPGTPRSRAGDRGQAVRHLAGFYPYDTFENHEDDVLTLRAGAEQVNQVLEMELSERFQRAGVHVIEARLSHLAYASEVAEVMLRRQLGRRSCRSGRSFCCASAPSCGRS